MSKKEVNAKLVEVKLTLARKYESLAKASHSTPKRRTFMHQAARFRRQAADTTRQ